MIAPRGSRLLALGGLTTRERQITQLLLRGTPYGEIARELWISSHTLRGHIKAIFAKLRVHSRSELAALLLASHLDSGGGPAGYG